MELTTVKNLISITRHAIPHKKLKFPISSLRQNRCPVCSFKKSNFQDFQQCYAKPIRLLPAEEAKTYMDTSTIKPAESSEFESVYKIQLFTSSLYDSGLSDPSAGILVCIIDENGYTILQRLPACSDKTEEPGELSDSFMLHFQRGSTDAFIFRGPKLGKLQALWISTESGSWRLGGAKLLILSSCEPQEGNSVDTEMNYSNVRYSFDVDEDILIGEGSDDLMVELRPSLVSQTSGDASLSFEYNGMANKDLGITNEESMEEYTNLKISLLLYDAILIIAGTYVSSFTADENTTVAFLVGGLGGFLYLFLLQRSVDRLPSPELKSLVEGDDSKNGSNVLLGGSTGLVLALAFGLGLAMLIAKRDGLVDAETLLTPRELLLGMMGFLVSKIAVLLAAFKPLSIKSKKDM